MTSLKGRIARVVGDALGIHLIPKKHAAYWPERYFVERMFARLKPDCVFDVGANEGQYAQSLRRDGFTGTILSFEPNPAAFERLAKAAAADPAWHCYPFAFGREAGTASFNVMNEDVFSSFHAPVHEAGTAFIDENRVVETVEVQVRRLDEAMPELEREHRFRQPFLKMDTQGFDLEVFAGAGSERSRFCALESEVSVRRLYDGAPTMAESLAAYADGGFDLAALHSVHARLPLKVIEFNCYCVRHDLAERDVVG